VEAETLTLLAWNAGMEIDITISCNIIMPGSFGPPTFYILDATK
jgi:DNA polymerase III sliding clamp (beta) subunit (PCNA family)